jgi:hypothetical protein
MLVAPAHTPSPIVDKLPCRNGGRVASAEVRQQFIELGVTPINSPLPADLTRHQGGGYALGRCGATRGACGIGIRPHRAIARSSVGRRMRRPPTAAPQAAGARLTGHPKNALRFGDLDSSLYEEGETVRGCKHYSLRDCFNRPG